MPILEMHLKADELLFGKVDIKRKDDFKLGSLFPDVFWMGVDVEDRSDGRMTTKDMLNDTLHCSVYVEGSLRFPNYFYFFSVYRILLRRCDFMRGMLFHLMLDTYYNRQWLSKVVSLSKGSYIIKSDISGDIKVDKEFELLRYKYSDMRRYCNKDNFVISLPKVPSKEARDIVNKTFYYSKHVLSDMLSEINKFIESDSNLEEIHVFDDKYYDDVIDETIREYILISKLEGWE